MGWFKNLVGGADLAPASTPTPAVMNVQGLPFEVNGLDTQGLILRALRRLLTLRYALSKAQDQGRIDEVLASINIYRGKLMAMGLHLPTEVDEAAWIAIELEYGVAR